MSAIGSLLEFLADLTVGFGPSRSDSNKSKVSQRELDEAAWREKHGSDWAKLRGEKDD